MVGSAWGNASTSLSKASEAVRAFASRLALGCPSLVTRVLCDLATILIKTCRRDKCSEPGTWELLEDPGLLKFGLP